MARYKFQRRVFEGGPVFAAGLTTQVTVTNLDTLTLEPLYLAETGSGQLGNPFYITELGKFEFWIESGNYKVFAQNGGNTDNFEGQIGPYPGGGEAFRETLAITADVSLLPSSSGVDLYTVSGTSADIDITVPSGLGDGFYMSIFHQGSGSLTFVGSGVTISPPPGGTLLLSQGMYASVQVFGSDALVKLIGLTTTA